MTARAQILARIRAQQGKPACATAAEHAAVVDYIAAHPSGPLPAVESAAVARFCAAAQRLTTTLEIIDAPSAIPAAVAQYLHSLKLPTTAVCWPEYAMLDWAAQGLSVTARPIVGSDLVGITGAFCGIAETGTLMMCSSANTPAATSLLPETHIAVLSRARIVLHMESAWALLRHELGLLPRAVNFISGPSRTADIEQTVTLGAHGPYRVHVLLLP
jgi:L-lactate dehydrogenase complex protein LldG